MIGQTHLTKKTCLMFSVTTHHMYLLLFVHPNMHMEKSCIALNLFYLKSRWTAVRQICNLTSNQKWRVQTPVWPLSLVTRKPAFGVCDQVSHKTACAAKEAR